ncbi:MAG: aminotransferase class IV, partial [Euryarchaeota archaeon]|nr:aminotransferase class IV [Euryarchaeota archaeon]
MSRVWWNGHEMPRQKLPTSPGSRLGDGVFETLRTYEGVPFLLGAHLDRLFSGARSIRLLGLPSRRSLESMIRGILVSSRRRDRVDHVVRILLTEGGARMDVTVVLDRLPTGAAYQGTRGLRVGTSSYPHPGAFFLPAGAKGPAKWVGRGPRVHARREAQRRGWDEAILANARGAFVE